MRVEQFDKYFKAGLERHEFAANTDAVWARMADRIELNNNKFNLGGWLKGSVAAGVLALAGIGTWFITSYQPKTPMFLAEQTVESVAVPSTLVKPVEMPVEESLKELATSATVPAINPPEIPAPQEQALNIEKEVEAKTQHLQPCIRLNKEVICSGEWVEVQTDYCAEGSQYIIEWNNQPLRGRRHRLRMTRDGENVLALYAVQNNQKQLLNTQKVMVHPKNKTEFLVDDNVSNEEPAYHFKVKNGDAISATWKFDNGAVIRDLTTAFMFSSKGAHRIKVTTVNEHGCMDSTERMVFVRHAYNLRATSVFNPTQAKWLPAGLHKLQSPYKLQIVNQDGKVIFVSTAIHQVWDGKLPDNTIAQVGDIFYWVARIDNGRDQEFGGEILIVGN